MIDAGTAAVHGSVDLGGEVGNVVYDPATDRMLVAVQGRGNLAVIDPATLAVARRIASMDSTNEAVRLSPAENSMVPKIQPLV